MNTFRKQILDDTFDSFTMLAGAHFVSVYDIKAHLTRFSAAAVKMFNLPGEYVEDGAFHWVEYIHPEDRQHYKTVMQDLIAGASKIYDITYRTRTRDGSYTAFRHRGAVLRDRDGQPSFVGGIIINEGRLERTDAITMLPNQDAFFSDLHELLAQGHRCVLLLMGIRHLAQLNQTFGYSYVNRILQQAAWLLQKESAAQAIAYRLNGSRFALISKNGTDLELAKLYTKIQRKLRSEITLSQSHRSLATSGGLMVVDDFGRSEHAIYSCLHSVYRESKHRQDGELVFFNHLDDTDTRQKVTLLEQIHNCMTDACQGFFLNYQPVFANKTHALIAAEALLRWNDATYGTIYPKDFLSILVEDFAFEELGYWILKHAMQDGATFLQQNPSLQLAINVAACQIRDPYFADAIFEIAQQTGFPTTNLCLELSKMCRQIPFQLLQKRLVRLQDQGIKIVLDDFGRGYGSLECLRALSCNYVKFDASFLQEISTRSAQLDLRLLCALVTTHDINVCLKGIETQSMLEIVETMKIASLQGFYLAKPMDCESFQKQFLTAAKERI